MAEEELHQVPPLESVWRRSSGDLLDGPRRRRESMVNKLISTVYSGPTISDIESALSFTGGAAEDNNYSSGGGGVPSPVVLSGGPELNSKVLMSKMENKYTLRIKACGNAEDGYKWRKYGQKSIKNSPNPRSYYRCTNPRCNAKKQVERATDEADTLLVTYEGLHLHYTYSHFLQLQHHQQQPPPDPPAPAAAAAGGGGSTATTTTTSSKKPKLQSRGRPAAPPPAAGDLDLQFLHGGSSWQLAAAASPPRRDDDAGLMLEAAVFPEQEEADQSYDGCIFADDHHQQQQLHSSNNNNNNGGLLEDVVPLLVRRPCSSGSSSSPTASLSTTSSSVSWNNNIDMAILSNIF